MNRRSSLRVWKSCLPPNRLLALALSHGKLLRGSMVRGACKIRW